MKNNPCQAETELSMLTSAAGGSQSPLISVTEAAHRLGVSKSTVYRIDRKNGYQQELLQILHDLNLEGSVKVSAESGKQRKHRCFSEATA